MIKNLRVTLFFFLITFIGISQTQIGQDIDGTAITEATGEKVSLSGDGTVVAVSALNDNGSETFTGVVRIYKNILGIWTQLGQDIYGENTNDISGWSISLSEDGTILAIGAIHNNGDMGDSSNSGHVRVYENILGDWTQIGQDINGEGIGDNEGYSVSLSDNGTILAVGAGLGYNENGARSGHVRIFQYSNNTWVQIGQNISGQVGLDYFGGDLSFNGDGTTIAIGAPRNDNYAYDSGNVKVYKNISGDWTQIGQDINGESVSDLSGYSVSLSNDGTIVAIGAIYNDGNGMSSGHVRVYEYSNNIWVQIGQDIDGELTGDQSGYSISLSNDGTILAVGAPYNDGTDTSAGHVRIYNYLNNIWVQIGEDIDGEEGGDESGGSVSLSSDGSILAVGAHHNNGNGFNSGHVRVFSIASELAILEVIDDIQGNSNGINVTASQLNNINGVSGAIDGVNYTTALDNGSYADENNPTALEIQFIIDQVNSTLSVNDNNPINFLIYPNPAKNQFTIQLNEGLMLEKVVVYNSLGQFITSTEEKVLKTSNFSSGLYYVELITNKGKATKKLIIE